MNEKTKVSLTLEELCKIAHDRDLCFDITCENCIIKRLAMWRKENNE